MKIDRTDVINAGHEAAWKYFVSVNNAIEAMNAYKHIIQYCLDKKKENFESILKGDKSIDEDEMRSFPPGDFVRIDGINISLRFLVSIHTQSFFQYGRNCFDYIAQIIAEYFCGNMEMYNVDFAALIKRKDAIAPHDVRKYIEDISSSKEFQYICDYNNTVKHNYDLGVSISVKTENLDMEGKTPAFTKNMWNGEIRSHETENMDELLPTIYKFLVGSFNYVLELVNSSQQDNITEEG